jgi:hypothetical protein
MAASVLDFIQQGADPAEHMIRNLLECEGLGAGAGGCWWRWLLVLGLLVQRGSPGALLACQPLPGPHANHPHSPPPPLTSALAGEHGYINTDHPEFIGGAKAIRQVGRRGC